MKDQRSYYLTRRFSFQIPLTLYFLLAEYITPFPSINPFFHYPSYRFPFSNSIVPFPSNIPLAKYPRYFPKGWTAFPLPCARPFLKSPAKVNSLSPIVILPLPGPSSLPLTHFPSHSYPLENSIVLYSLRFSSPVDLPYLILMALLKSTPSSVSTNWYYSSVIFLEDCSLKFVSELERSKNPNPLFLSSEVSFTSSAPNISSV